MNTHNMCNFKETTSGVMKVPGTRVIPHCGLVVMEHGAPLMQHVYFDCSYLKVQKVLNSQHTKCNVLYKKLSDPSRAGIGSPIG